VWCEDIRYLVKAYNLLSRHRILQLETEKKNDVKLNTQVTFLFEFNALASSFREPNRRRVAIKFSFTGSLLHFNQLLCGVIVSDPLAILTRLNPSLLNPTLSYLHISAIVTLPFRRRTSNITSIHR
jgi:hypothetical protein